MGTESHTERHRTCSLMSTDACFNLDRDWSDQFGFGVQGLGSGIQKSGTSSSGFREH